MAKKIKVKLILELLEAQMSQREICRTRKMSQHSVGDVCRLAKELGITYHNVKDKTDEEVYRMFYPEKHVTETLYKNPDYSYYPQRTQTNRRHSKALMGRVQGVL